jgi:hypothetical protein
MALLNDRGVCGTSQVSEHVTTCMLNVAACYLKTQQPAVVLYCCDQVSCLLCSPLRVLLMTP